MAHNPTQHDIAKALGVSRGLVSLALSGSPLVADATRERIRATARELGYTRNVSAAALATRRSSVVGVVLPDLRNPFHEGVVDDLQQQAEAQGMLALISTAADDPAREGLALRRFLELRVAGVIVVAPVEERAALEQIGTATPLVLVGAVMRGHAFDTVHIDEIAAGRMIVEHVRARGWQRIVALTAHAGSGDVWVSCRQAALVRAAAEAGVPLDRVEADADNRVSARLGSQLANHPQARTAIVTHNDLIAADVLSYVRAAGLTPGRDVAVIGFDDTYLARRPEFDLTSVSQDRTQLTRRAMNALHARLEYDAGADGDGRSHGREWVITPSLVVRSSS